MLNVFLLILKIIGIVLLSIIGIVLFLLLIILCVPIRYRINAYKGVRNDDYYGKLNISFILHIISAWVVYSDELNVYIKLFGIRIYDRNRKKLKEEKRAEKEAKKYKTGSQMADENADDIKEDESVATYTIDWNDESDDILEKPNDVKEEGNSYDSSIADLQDKSGINVANAESENVGAYSVDNEDAEHVNNETNNESPEEDIPTIDKVINKIKDVSSKIGSFFDKGEQLSDKIVNKLDELSKKYDNFSKMTNDYRYRKAFSKIWSQVKYLLVNLAPKKARGRIHFGFDDPATTGQILMYLGICAPFLPSKVSYEPDFESVGIDGELYINGRFALVRVIIVLCRLFFDKNVRRLWKKYKSNK